jgi:hypothetical protein
MHATRLGVIILAGLFVAWASIDSAACDCDDSTACDGSCRCCQCDSISDATSEPHQSDALANALKGCMLETPFVARLDSIRIAAIDRPTCALSISAGRMKPTEVEQLIARGFPTGNSAFWTNVEAEHRAWAKGNVPGVVLRYRLPVPPLEHELAAIDGVAMRFEDDGAAHPIYR